MWATAVLHAMLLLSAAAVVVLIYRYDLYDKEPWYMAILAIALGGAMMATQEWLQMRTINALGDFGFSDVGIALVASTHEELGKFIIVLMIALVFRGVFNDPADGIIYGSLVGLGAAIVESYDHVAVADDLVLLPGEIIRQIGHAVFGGITGYGLGKMVVRRRRWPLVALATLLAATLLHFAWDVIAFTHVEIGTLHNAAAVVVMLLGLLLYGWLVRRAARFSREHFEPEHHHRLFGWPFNKVLHE